MSPLGDRGKASPLHKVGRPTRIILASLAALLFLTFALFDARLPGRAPSVRLPRDRGLVAGALPSGLSYYLRPTTAPEDRLVFRLVAAVGTSDEAESERGFAHFVEHMAFNGTASYPGNALDDLIFSLDGGRDLEANAFTYPDYTVYHLELPPDYLDLGLRILREWASAIRFDPGEVEREKGVIRAELREYDTPEDRVREVEENALYASTPFADRAILGTPESVNRAGAALLEEFYRRLYRPERMALIVSGPFAAELARRSLVRAFADFGEGGVPERPPALRFMDPPEELAVVRGTDARAARVELRLLLREAAPRPGSPAAWLREYRARLTSRVLAGRLEDLGAAADVPWIFLGADRWEERAGERLWEIALSCLPGQELEALRSLGREVGALASFGARTEEAGIAAREIAPSLPSSDPDAYEAVDSCLYAFLYGDGLPDPGVAADLEARLRSAALAPGSDPVGTAVGDLPPPGAGVLSLLSPAGVGRSDDVLRAAFLEGVARGKAEGPARTEVGRAADGLAADPPEGAGLYGTAVRGPASRSVLPDGTVDLVLGNGLRVQVLSTDSGEGWVYLGAWSPGGLSAAPERMRAAADEAPGILRTAGYPGASRAGLREELAGTWISWRSDVDPRGEFVEVDGASEDLDSLLRLLASTFRRPVVPPDAVRKAALARAEELRRAGGSEAALRAALERAASPASVWSSPEEMEGWTADRVLSAWENRFGDASDFSFLVVGNMDAGEAERLAEKHLGGLPARGGRETLPGPTAPPTPGEHRIRAVADDPRGGVAALWFPRGLAAGEERALEALARELEYRLFRRLREDLAETYDVRCSWTPYPEYPGSGEFRVEFEAVPERARALAGELARELRDLAEGRGLKPWAGGAPSESGQGLAAAEGDRAVYARRFDELKGAPPPPYGTSESEPGPWMETAARRLSPESAAFFVLYRD